jgi:outer membrane protein assembly factor BamD
VQTTPSHRCCPTRTLLTTLAVVLLAVGLSACNRTKKDDPSATAASIYTRAHKQIIDGTYEAAAKSYESLEARFPFSNEARQGRLDIMYAYYRSHSKEQAIDAADQFIRENPTHPRVDYAYYIKGLVYFERSPNAIESFFNVDMAQRPPGDARKSFEAFFRLVQLFPQSDYAPDARQRMIYLRNRLAEYEINVARFYVRRGAYVAALNRCKTVLENYSGSPMERDALYLSVEAYDKLGMKDLADQTQQVIAANYSAGDAPKSTRHWWQRW